MAKSFQSWAEEKGYEISERQVRYSASMGNRMGDFGSIAGTGGSARTQAGNAMKFLDETFFSTFLVTTLPAPIIESSPIVRPHTIVEFAPIEQPFLKRVFLNLSLHSPVERG